MALLITFLVVAVVVGFALTLAVGWIVIVPVIALAVAGLFWGGRAAKRGTTPGDLVRGTRRTELLGPGGPDDPDAVR
jgi:hypothetical protein